MAKSKKAVAQSTVEQTEVIAKLIDGIGVVEVNVEPAVVEEAETTQPSMLATMLQQEVKPLEEVKAETEQKPTVVKVEKNQGVGAFVKKLIAEGLTNTAILKIVHEQYGNTNTTYACVAWYRNKMKKTAVEAKNVSATNIVTEMLKEEVKQDVPPEGFAQEAVDQNPGFPESEV